MDLQLKGKKALISGSTAGIGLAIAKTLAGEGAAVFIAGRSQEKLQGARESIQSSSGNKADVVAVAADLATAEGVETMINAVSDVDILVNNLGIYEAKSFFDLQDSDWMSLFLVNVMSGIRLARHYMRGMLERNFGRIIFISSESSIMTPPEMIHYGLTKSAQLAVARGLAELTKGTNVTVNSVLPGPTRSEGVVDFLQSMSSKLNATLATIPPLETTIKRAIYRLSVLVGSQPPALEPELSEATPVPDIPEIVTLGQPEGLLRRRPDIRVAERNLAATTATIGIAVADLFPRVTFIGSVAFEAGSLSNFGSRGSDSFSFGPRISWAAFDLGRVRARIRQVDARAEAALAQYEQRVLIALEETEDALVDFGRQQAQRDYLRESALASETATALARLRYQYGVSDFLTVLDAERTLLQAQDQLAQSETTTATALVAVYKALGGGWQ